MIKTCFYIAIILISAFFMGDSIECGDWLCIGINCLPIIFILVLVKKTWNEWFWGSWNEDEMKHCNLYKLQNDFKPNIKRQLATIPIVPTFTENDITMVKENHHIELFEVIKENEKLIEEEKAKQKAENNSNSKNEVKAITTLKDEYKLVYNAIIDYLVKPNNKTNQYRSEVEVKAILEYIKFIAINDKSVTLYVSKKFNELIIEAKISIGTIITSIKEVEKEKKISFVTTDESTILDYYKNENH